MSSADLADDKYATTRAALGLVRIRVVAFFVVLNDAVPTEATETAAFLAFVVAAVVVTIITLFARLNDAVTAV